MKEKYAFLSRAANSPGGLIQGLQLIQAAFGYIPDDGIGAAAEHFGRTTAEVESTVAFYGQFKRVKPGKYRIAVCDGSACRAKGSEHLCEWILQELGLRPGETDEKGTFSVETATCLGCCSQAPAMSVNGKIHSRLDRKNLAKILRDYAANEQ